MLAGGAKQHAQHRGHRPIGDADVVANFLVFLDRATQDRFAEAEAALGQTLAVVSPGVAFTTAGGEGLEFEVVVHALGQDDRTPLGVEHADGVVQHRLKQGVLALGADQVMAGAEQGEQLVAGTGGVVAVQQEAVDAFLPGGGQFALDNNLICGGGIQTVGDSRVDKLHHHRDLAELDNVAGMNLSLGRAETNAVDVSAVGAAEILHPPTGLGQAQIRVPTAHRRVIQDNFHGADPTDVHDGGRLPGLALDLAADASETNHDAHRTRLPAIRHNVGCRRIRPAGMD